MSDFSAQITRLPIPYDAVMGREAAQGFAHYPQPLCDLIAGAAGCSPYLKELLRKQGAWLDTALTQGADLAFETVLKGLDSASLSSLGVDLRIAKSRTALLVALADLGGVWDTMAVTRALTRLADRAVQLCVQHLVGDEIRRGKLPMAASEDAATGAGFFVLAMGKMGAYELNYSSDIDLICLFDQDRYGPSAGEARAAFVRVVRRMSAMLQDITDQGYVFRVDLRLRPDAAVTPVCLSMAAAEAYYEAEGRTWERAAYIKARVCAGDMIAGARFLKTLTPFVWRRHLDFAAIQDAHDMRLRIRAHRGLNGPMRLEGHNMKLGAGGIREIEFYAQTRQLIAGGRDVSLRDPTTLGALRRLAEKGWTSASHAAELTGLYLAHREVEHRIQMIGDAQTHDVPNSAEGIARLAALCGQTEGDFRAQLLYRLAQTDQLTDAFFNPAAPTKSCADAENLAPALPDEAGAIIEGWQAYPALRSPRAQTLFQRLLPQLSTRIARADAPLEALMALDGFLAGLPAGVQIFALFDANPALVDLITDIAATAPSLARYLSRNSSVLDGVIGGSFFAPWPGKDTLTNELANYLAAQSDYEAQLDGARVWQKEWHFRIGVHLLRGLISPAAAGAQYADLAEAVISALWPVVLREFSRRHGAPPGRGAAVLGMGSLGAGRLNAASDLDVILIYDAGTAETSQGPRPLPTRQYFARLTQAFVTSLSAQTAKGRLYEVDVRLRPSGRQGPVATSLASFENYQQSEAWTWEHLALTRARVMAGDARLAADIEALRCAILACKGQGAAVRADVAEMRARLCAANPGVAPWEAKLGAGRMMDIELFTQTLALICASPARGAMDQLQAGKLAGFLTQTDALALQEAYNLMVKMQTALRLLGDGGNSMSADPDQLGAGGRAFVASATGRPVADLTQDVRCAAARADVIISAFLGAEAA
ncbi:MAG: bifunctional [glutamine synthetase] adenylyltransferase/[glutamine synthetase]-adenylyl-L-tyrosine phosphorylase [Cypionkella sp.]|nr:bifunctional [glutamine synthetase] adenylyltransferase/[glutamine synthetase]-adenylyl-L-tyrosine phosphorylase [Cypionkella sp.]